MTKFKVIIAGGREFNDYSMLVAKMDKLLSKIECPIVVLCGEARGADSLGSRYAKERGYEIESYPADWGRLGKSAGYARNADMARNADALVAFWDGNSPGTRHMITLAKERGLAVRVVNYS